MPHLIRRQFFAVQLALTAYTVTPTIGGAQQPWKVTIDAPVSLRTGYCTPVGITVLDATTGAAPRNQLGARVTIADFDMTVASGGAVVGRYAGASAWSACACPASQGAVATIAATYPARSLVPEARVRGVALQSSTDVPVVDGNLSGVPIGCETYKTTTVDAGSGAPWTVTLTSNTSPIQIGTCSLIQIDLRDATGKEDPRNPESQRVSLADFDMAVTSKGVGAVAGQYTGPSFWSACACQRATVGALATITATYPGRALAERARVPDVAFQSSIAIPLSATQGKFNPPACESTAAAPAPAPAPPAAPPPVAAYNPGPVTVNLALSANGSWDEFAPGPVIVTLALSAQGSWYVPQPVTVTFSLLATGSWIERSK